VHAVIVEHTVSLVGVAAADWYCTNQSHLNIFLHTRSAEAVGALVSNSSDLQSLMLEHILSELNE
jgi:hypothetical protein